MQSEQKIPKIIHYCWFGGNPLPDSVKVCIESWKKYCPDYEIMEWNEQNFPVDHNRYVKEAYEAKKWAFVSDVARLYGLVTFGGIYMDTDVEVLKPLDDLLEYEAIGGFESPQLICTAFMACKKGHPLFERLFRDYDNERFLLEDGSLNLTTNVMRLTEACLAGGLKPDNKAQTVYNMTVMPSDFFSVKDPITGLVQITENSYTVHHFSGTWISDEKRYAKEFRERYHKILPRCVALHISGFIAACKFRGFVAAIHEIGNYFKDVKKQKNRRKKLKKRNEEK